MTASAPTREDRRRQIMGNYDAFQRALATCLPKHAGEYALLRDREVVDFFSSPGSADQAGLSRFPDGLYSIQLVTSEPVELGLYANTPD